MSEKKQELQPFQQRVVDEKKDLDSKIEKLNNFTKTDEFENLIIYEQKDLLDQLTAMRNYSYCLGRRIERF